MHIYNNKRHETIMSILNENDYVSVQKLSDTLGVSLVTIRKDLTVLEKGGYLYRTHGGASKKNTYAFELNVIEKESINVEQKVKIAQKALSYINENDFILLASGTTIHYLSRIIDNFNNLTVLTSSMRVAIEMCKKPNINTIQLGGTVRKSSTSVVGSISESILNQFSCNKLFLGVDGIDTHFGISTSNAAEAHLNKIMIDRADKVYVLADSSKINKCGFGKISNIDKIDVLITDEFIKKSNIKELESVGVEVVITD